MAARTKSKVTPKYKTKYRVRNWAVYEESLRRRGDITVWFDADAVDSWNAPPSGRPGGQKEYSDVAIETTLTLRSLFHLGLRQIKGFVGSLVPLMGLELRVPDHTTLSRRGRTIDVRGLPRKGDGPLHLVIDSTGLKVVGGAVRYERHRPETTLLYQLVDAHYPVFADRMVAQGTPLPNQVQREFEDYLKFSRRQFANHEPGKFSHDAGGKC